MKFKIRILTSLFFLASCNYSVDKGSTEVATPDTSFSLVGNQITYQMVTSRVLAKNCLDCHSEKGGNRGGLNLENYQNVFEARDFIRSEILSRRMPKSPAAPLSNQQIDFLVKWIDAGAAEFVKDTAPVNPPAMPPVVEPPAKPPIVVTPPPVATEPLTFANVMDKVVTPKCLKCHGAGTSNSVKLVTFADLSENKLMIKEDITTNRMPLRGSLTPGQKKLILDWIEAGAPQT